jgi:hypothetical protein
LEENPYLLFIENRFLEILLRYKEKESKTKLVCQQLKAEKIRLTLSKENRVLQEKLTLLEVIFYPLRLNFEPVVRVLTFICNCLSLCNVQYVCVSSRFILGIVILPLEVANKGYLCLYCSFNR